MCRSTETKQAEDEQMNRFVLNIFIVGRLKNGHIGLWNNNKQPLTYTSLDTALNICVENLI